MREKRQPTQVSLEAQRATVEGGRGTHSSALETPMVSAWLRSPASVGVSWAHQSGPGLLRPKALVPRTQGCRPGSVHSSVLSPSLPPPLSLLGQGLEDALSSSRLIHKCTGI